MKLLGAPAADENSIYVDAFDDTLANAMIDVYDITGTTKTLGNADATLASTDRRAILGATLTAVRTITLPAASAIPAGVPIAIIVPSGAISTSYALVFAAAGSDTIHGAASAGMMTHGLVFLASDGVSAWSMTRLPAVSLEVATQEDVTTTTLTDSTALKRYVPPGKYRVRAEFTIWSANASEGVRGNVAFSGTATTRAARHQVSANDTGATSTMSSRAMSISSTALAGNDPLSFTAYSTGSGYFFREFILTVTAGGFLSVQFAHWSGTSSTCSLGVGSQLQIEPIR